ncbi:EpsG family protein [uncultured Vagococcus sp.]|uniref:EpsG family protein n=1 Tax=uncultured Vagococcus sp. TaxID=189676 RepID=UPI0028D48239|nr:EpsG family protein [uncultured Vagococcus sp.]
MFVYFGIFFLIVLMSIAEIFTKSNKFFYAAGVIMILFSGLRFEMGYDYNSYRVFFEKITSFSDIFNGGIDAEPGYLFFNFLFSVFGLTFYHFLFFFSVISVSLLMIFLNKSIPYPTMGLVYYYARFFIVRDMGQIRSSIACIICLFAIPFIKGKRWVPFLIIVGIASLFHIVSLAMILVYLFYHMFSEITVKSGLVWMAVCQLGSVILSIPSLYIWLIPGRYATYFTSTAYTSGSGLLNPILWMQMAIFIGASYTFLSKKNINYTNQEVVLKEYFLSSLILILFGSLGTVGGRISTVFATTEILVVPLMFQHLLKNKYISLIAFYLFSLVVLILIFVVSGAYNGYVPYDTVF